MDIGTLTGQIEIEDQLSGVLGGITNRIRSFSGMFGQMAKDVVTGSAAISAGIVGITTSIIALGNRGSDVNDVASTFENFSGSVDIATESLERMRAGTLGTVSDFDLMKSSNKLLASGMKLTSDQFSLMSRAAFVLQNQGLGPTKEMLDLVSQALLTGRTRTLEMRLGKIDLRKAEDDFAKSVGATREQLTQAGKTEAARIAIFDLLNRKVREAGEQQRDFGEQMEFVITKVKNWGDTLARSVASSPAVMNALKAIGDALAKTFGDAPQTAIEIIVKGIEMFAGAVGRTAPVVIQMIGAIRDRVIAIWNELVAFNERWQITSNLIAAAKFAWGVLQRAFELVQIAVQAVIQAWSAMPPWLQRLTRGSLEAAAAMAVYTVSINAVATPLRTLIGGLDLGINIIGNLTGTIYTLTRVTWLWQSPIVAVTDAYKALTVWLTTSRIGMDLLAVKTVAVAEAKTFLAAVTLATSNAFAVLAGRLGLTNLAMGVSLVASRSLAAAKALLAASVAATTLNYNVLIARLGLTNASMGLSLLVTKGLAAVKGFLATAILAVSINYNVLIARLNLATAAMTASAIAGKAVTGVMTTLGLVIMGIQVLPLVAALAGIALGIREVIRAWQNWQEAKGKGKTFWGDVAWERDLDTWPRRWINFATQFVAGVDIFETGVNRLNKLKPNQIIGAMPVIDPEALAGGSAEMREARALREGRGLATGGPDIDLFKSDVAAGVESLTKSWRAAARESEIFRQAFASLSDEQRSNFAIQETLVAGINKLQAAGQTLTPAMIKVRDSFTATRLEMIEKDKATLAGKGITQGLVDQEMRHGKTLAEVAAAYGVAENALSAYLAEAARAAQIEQNLQSFSASLLEQQEKDRKRLEDRVDVGNREFADANRRLQEMIRRDSMTTVEYQIDQIDRLAAEQIAGLKGDEAARRSASVVIRQIAERQKRELMLDNEVLLANNLETLGTTAMISRITYEEMAAHPELYKESAIRAQLEITEAAEKAADVTRTVWDETWDTLQENVQDAVSSFPQLLVDAFTGGGGLIGAVKALGVKIADAIVQPIVSTLKKTLDDLFKKLSIAKEAAIGIGSGIAAAVGGAAGGTTGSLVGGIAGAAGGLAAAGGLFGAGIAASTVAIGAMTAGIGAAAVGVFLLGKKFFGVSGEIKKAREAVVEFEDSLHETLTQTQLNEAGGERWKATVIAVRDAYMLVGKSASDAERDVLQLWDTDHPNRARAAADTIALNVALSQNIKSVRTLVQEYIGAGQKMPDALQKNIDQLVKMGKLTAANATEILNLTKTAVPAYADVTAAAERYGIEIEALGTAVQGLRITEIAEQMVKDFELFELAGADGVQVMLGMQEEVQKLVTDALKLGIELPKTLEPYLMRMIDAGLLTDDLGEKLVDTSKLKFAETLTEKVEKLVDAMLRLATVIENNVGGALDDLAGRRIDVEINPVVNSVNTDNLSGGGVVYAARGTVIPFRPRGSDTVPAMLTPGERVLSVAQNRAYEADMSGRGGSTVILEIDKRTMAEIVVPEIPEVVKRYRIGRGRG